MSQAVVLILILKSCSHALSRAIIDLVDSNNVSVFKGREATGFSNTEEEMINLVKV